MRASTIGLSLGTVLLLSASAFADPASAPAAQPAAASNKDRLICHYFVHEGMLLKTSQCKTQQAWDLDRENYERQIATIQYRSYSHPPGK